MTNREDLTQKDSNMLSDLAPHRDRIVGLPEKKQPHHTHSNDSKSYLERHEQIPQEILDQNKDASKDFNKNIPASKLDKPQIDADSDATIRYGQTIKETGTDVGMSTVAWSGAQSTAYGKANQTSQSQQGNLGQQIEEDFFPNAANIKTGSSQKNKDEDKNILEKAKEAVEGGIEKLKNIFSSS
jgi:hypothetical protein